jgi:hypothetical protein
LELYGRITNQELVDLVGRMFDPKEPRATPEELSKWKSLAATANLIETMGVLCGQGAITEEVIYQVWGGPIATVWRAWTDAMPKLRHHLDEADVFANFQRLGKAMEARLPEAKRASSARDSQAGEAVGSGTNDQSSVLHSNETGNRFSPGRILVVLAAALTVSALWGVLKRVIRA